MASRDRSPLLRYGSEDALPMSASNTAKRVQKGFFKKPTLFYALNGIALLALLSVCVSMHSTITRLEAQVATTSGHAAASVPSTVSASSRRRHRQPHREDATPAAERLPMAFLPSKFAVDYVTPRQDQAHRGTCWDFATIGFLEQSYRENGVLNGWLAEDEYVAFSEQVCVVQLCIVGSREGSPCAAA